MDSKSYVDVNVFIFWLGNHPSFGKTAYQWIKKIEESTRGKYVTSTLTIYQTLVIVAGLTGKNLKDQELVEEIVNLVKNLPGLTIAPLTVEDTTQAAKLMKEYDLDYEDALHLAAALRNKAKEIISNDKDFDKTPLKRKFD
ncbi:MAG: type II toxin-antitoxin system VapC family toxin [Candidatus Bathyarchaeia archaeon]